MASKGLVWDGMQEYIEALRKLPEECQAEAAKDIEGEVNGAYVTIADFYEAHRFTGNLRRGLRISAQRGGLVLKSTAPHASIFEKGTRVRHYITENGVRHITGRMPATFIFGRTVSRARRRLTERFTEMLFRKGAAKVTVAA